MRVEIELNITDKMLKHFLNLSLSKEGEVIINQRNYSDEMRYLNNFLELGLIYEITTSWSDMGITSNYHITKVGEIIRKNYVN